MMFNKKEYMKEYNKEWRLKNPNKIREFSRKWYLKNKEKVKEYHLKNQEKIKEAQKRYRLKNKEKRKEYDKKWRLKNKEHSVAYMKAYRVRNREHRRKYNRKFYGNEYCKKYRLRRIEHFRKYDREWHRNKRRNDPSFRLLHNLRRRLNHILKGERKSASTMELVGCTLEELWTHLKSCPTWESWMTQENYGAGGWDIDHIIPCEKFDHTDPAQQRKCWHYSNLQPMEHIKNLKKGAKIIYVDFTSPKT